MWMACEWFNWLVDWWLTQQLFLNMISFETSINFHYCNCCNCCNCCHPIVINSCNSIVLQTKQMRLILLIISIMILSIQDLMRLLSSFFFHFRRIFFSVDLIRTYVMRHLNGRYWSLTTNEPISITRSVNFRMADILFLI